MMNAITLRNLSDEATRALAERAAESGRTVEAEAERLLQDALAASAAKAPDAPNQTPKVGLGTALRQLGQKYPELADVDFSRDQTPAWTPSKE